MAQVEDGADHCAVNLPPLAPLATKEGAALLLFDSACLMCSAFVDWVVAHDDGGVFRFAALQGGLGAACLRRAGLPLDLSTLVLIDEEGPHTRSTAALRVLRRCSGHWPLLAALLGWVPTPLRDLGYCGVAALRYKVFGNVFDGGDGGDIMCSRKSSWRFEGASVLRPRFYGIAGTSA